MNEQNENTARENLLARVQHDLTYKPPNESGQVKLWKLVKSDFDDFRSKIREVFQMVNQIHLTEEIVGNNWDYDAYIVSLRETERWCNTAIANDYKEYKPIDITDLEYPAELPDNASQREMLCHQTSSACYLLGTSLVSYVPLGRSFSLALTHLQNTRGWILDIINDALENYDENES